MVKAWGREYVPGAASQRTRLESVEVTGEVGDDHLHDFVRNTAGRFVCGMCPRGRIVEEAIGLGFASIPGNYRAGQVDYSYDASGVGVRTSYTRLGVAILDI